MARKTAVPAEQLERLKQFYNQEREALVALANAEQDRSAAEDDLSAAQQALKQAQAGVDGAYQALAGIVGAGIAAELTGRAKNGRHPHPRQQNKDRGQASSDDHGSDAELGPAPVDGGVG